MGWIKNILMRGGDDCASTAIDVESELSQAFVVQDETIGSSCGFPIKLSVCVSENKDVTISLRRGDEMKIYIQPALGVWKWGARFILLDEPSFWCTSLLHTIERYLIEANLFDAKRSTIVKNMDESILIPHLMSAKGENQNETFEVIDSNLVRHIIVGSCLLKEFDFSSQDETPMFVSVYLTNKNNIVFDVSIPDEKRVLDSMTLEDFKMNGGSTKSLKRALGPVNFYDFYAHRVNMALQDADVFLVIEPKEVRHE